MRMTSIFCAALLVTSCLPAGYPSDRDQCTEAQARLTELGCREAKTPKGVPFEKVCREKLERGIDFGSMCIKNINTCDEVDTCVPR